MFFKANSTFLAAFLTAVIAFLLFLGVNGGLIFFFDSWGYFGGAEVLFKHLRGVDLTGGLSFLGRSIYYGLLMQWELRHAPFAPVQILSTAYMLALTADLVLGRGRPWVAAAITAVVALLTPLPFFVINAMPDVYAGLAVLGVALVLVYGERMSGMQRAGAVAVMILAVLFHQTHLILVGGFVAIALLGFATLALSRRIRSLKPFTVRLVPLVIVVLAGIGGDVAFRVGMEGIQGEEPMRRPFILGRMIADGPGYRYLKANCPEEGWVMCDHMQNLPINIDWFLWSAHPDRRVYTAMTRAERRQLEREEFTLVGRIIAAEPGAVLASAGHNWQRQLDMFTVEDFYYGQMVPGIEKNFGPLAGDIRAQRIVTSKPLLADLSRLQLWIVYAAFAGLICLSVRPRDGGGEDDRLFRLFAGLLVCGLLMNGAVCGMLSEPHHRYQARVIWLLPYAAMLYGALWWRWRRTAPSA